MPLTRFRLCRLWVCSVNKSVMITGANGFVGTALSESLSALDYSVTKVTRTSTANGKGVTVGSIGPSTDWTNALRRPVGSEDSMLRSVDVVVHLAARVHVLEERQSSAMAEFRKVNTAGTINLAKQAADQGVSRFVFVSSVKVNGEGYCSGKPVVYTEMQPPKPEDDYAVSKWEAEEALMSLRGDSDMDVVIVRPPLVYGPGVGANFLRLIRLIERGVPLPFGAVLNRRSLLYLGNFVDALRACIEHDAPINNTFLLSDAEPVSTTELIHGLARALHQKPRLVPVPVWALKLLGRVLNKQSEINRLVCSLELDNRKFCSEFNWKPPFAFHEGLAATATWYRRQETRGIV